MSYDTAQPYTASFLLFRKGKKVAFVLRSNTSWMNGFYGLPSGKVEINESFTECAIREAKEEVGAKIMASDLTPVLTMHRANRGDHAPYWVDLFFEVNKWEGELYNAEPDVHSELAWLDLNNLPDNIVPPVVSALEAIKAGKTYAEYGWEN